MVSTFCEWNIKTWIYIFILQLISFWLNLRSPDTCRLENILTSPPFSLTASTILIYLFLFCTSWDLAKQITFKSDVTNFKKFIKICIYLNGAFNIFKCTSTSLFTGSTFYLNLNNFHKYIIQHSLKSGGTKDHFRQVKVTGISLYWKVCLNIMWATYLIEVALDCNVNFTQIWVRGSQESVSSTYLT